MIPCPGDLVNYFSYDPSSGIVSWKVDVKGKGLAGEEAGSFNTKGYRRICFRYQHYATHRLAWFLHYGKWPIRYIDHINGDPSDNRITNLREASPAENTRNKKRSINNTSGVKGVTWHKRDKKWQATIEVHNKCIYIGGFKNLEDAKMAIEKKRLELHQEFTNHG